jgi:hypothetical protein
VYIPVTFYCYADSTQDDGQEFGWVKQEKIEFIINGGMELDSNWNNFGSPLTNERSSTFAYSDVYSRRVVGNSTNYGRICSPTFTTVTGKQYRMTAWVYVVSLTATNVGINCRSGDGATFLGGASTTTIGSWVRLARDVTESTGGGSAAVVAVQTGAGDSEFYVDDVSVREI